MHKLLRQVGRQAINRQEPWKRKILIEAQEICDVLEDEKGGRTVSGISFDISGIDEVSIGRRAFKRMPNLRFLKVYKRRYNKNDIMHITEDMEFPSRLRLLDWEAYPSKCLPPTFQTKCLVKLNMEQSQLEYLWQGIKPLTNLKKMNLSESMNLKEIPDLSNATNLEELDLIHCNSLLEIPSSFSHLHKLQKLMMLCCINLQIIPAHLNLASLDNVDMSGCSRLRNFPVISTHITELLLYNTAVEFLPSATMLCSRLCFLSLYGNGNLRGLIHLPSNLTRLDLSDSDIERIPDCIKALHQLEFLEVSRCRRLASLPELPAYLSTLYASDCESLETVFVPLNTGMSEFCFANCFKLDQQTQRGLIHQSFGRGCTRLPGREVPAEFDHRTRGNSLTIRLDCNRSMFIKLKLCLVILPNSHVSDYWIHRRVPWRRIVNGELVDEQSIGDNFCQLRTEHLFIFKSVQYYYIGKVSSEVVFEFSSKYQDLDIIECGAQILTEEISQNSDESEPLDDNTEDEEICDSKEDENLKGE